MVRGSRDWRETDREREREKTRDWGEGERERERDALISRPRGQFTTLEPKRTDLLERTARVKLNRAFFPR